MFLSRPTSLVAILHSLCCWVSNTVSRVSLVTVIELKNEDRSKFFDALISTMAWDADVTSSAEFRMWTDSMCVVDCSCAALLSSYSRWSGPIFGLFLQERNWLNPSNSRVLVTLEHFKLYKRLVDFNLENSILFIHLHNYYHSLPTSLFICLAVAILKTASRLYYFHFI